MMIGPQNSLPADFVGPRDKAYQGAETKPEGPAQLTGPVNSHPAGPNPLIGPVNSLPAGPLNKKEGPEEMIGPKAQKYSDQETPIGPKNMPKQGPNMMVGPQNSLPAGP
jgi:hypothetical protein